MSQKMKLTKKCLQVRKRYLKRSYLTGIQFPIYNCG